MVESSVTHVVGETCIEWGGLIESFIECVCV